ncbi:tetrahydrodipicolinate N-succinyltransferase N-terminal domain-containing protein [Campylobacter sp.]|uniref:tetrahydrodipicolinate N-succinyltransferase N-terminal domain-containing protein n=1 Tax=Campylobacter sp. TaxID=205 RepID=UPI0026DADED5|nr:tetrahydrodipicolinate N-succinyltransferase N-terminal domain-containing protein [Campylobacter sp.]MDO4674632.1 tetrahydrodipicolinate N-succinyltransferase N-terminal domain-containing protein [Campylobacter sp.]
MISTKEDFLLFVKQIEQKTNYKKPIAFGIARLDRGQLNKNKILQASFALVNYEENHASAAIMMEALMRRGVGIDFDRSELVQVLRLEDVDFALACFNPFLEEDGHKNIDLLKIIKDKFKDDEFALVCLFGDYAPLSVEAVYLKLYLLSSKKVAPRSLNLNGAFALLHNAAWSGDEPIELDYLRKNEMRLKMSKQYPKIDFVDKFPRFLAHIIPEENTRILDSAKVRMGAHLAAGTTIMPGASYVNFNAGTSGACMVEGRISSSAIVGEGSDVGGGASILGVLSGTNGNPITVGKACLLGANSVTGVPLGDDCVVDAGIAVLEGTKFLLKDREALQKMNAHFDFNKEIYKGIELSGLRALHFRQDSISGAMIVGFNKRAIKLNRALH